jgi:hypothetical protein
MHKTKTPQKNVNLSLEYLENMKAFLAARQAKKKSQNSITAIKVKHD